MTGLNLVNKLERAFLNAGWFTIAPVKNRRGEMWTLQPSLRNWKLRETVSISPSLRCEGAHAVVARAEWQPVPTTEGNAI
jgi:hypothetical protein